MRLIQGDAGNDQADEKSRPSPCIARSVFGSMTDFLPDAEGRLCTNSVRPLQTKPLAGFSMTPERREAYDGMILSVLQDDEAKLLIEQAKAKLLDDAESAKILLRLSAALSFRCRSLVFVGSRPNRVL